MAAGLWIHDPAPDLLEPATIDGEPVGIGVDTGLVAMLDQEDRAGGS